MAHIFKLLMIRIRVTHLWNYCLINITRRSIKQSNLCNTEVVSQRYSAQRAAQKNFLIGKLQRWSLFLHKVDQLKFLTTLLKTDSRTGPFLSFLHNFSENGCFCVMRSMWQLETQLFVAPYIELVYIFEASYSTLVTWVSKKSIVDQSELEK